MASNSPPFPAFTGAQAGQAPGPDAALPEKVADLEVQLAELKNERLRLLAEMENVRMIARRDVDTTRTYAIQSFAKSLLDVADTLSMAVDSVKPEALEDPAAKELRTLHEGVSMTRHSLMKLFANNGITQVCARCLFVLCACLDLDMRCWAAGSFRDVIDDCILLHQILDSCHVQAFSGMCWSVVFPVAYLVLASPHTWLCDLAVLASLRRSLEWPARSSTPTATRRCLRRTTTITTTATSPPSSRPASCSRIAS